MSTQTAPGVQPTPTTSAIAPTARTARFLAPDVARGFMLLAIILANTTVYVLGRPDGLLFRPIDGSPFDKVADVFGALLIDNRAYPMFAMLFAYGIHQLWSRELQRGTPRGRITVTLLKRYAWLLGFGLIHLLVFFNGDIISTYAIAGLLLIALVRARAWVLWLVFALTLPFLLLLGASDAGSASGDLPVVDMQLGGIGAQTALEALQANLTGGLAIVVMLPISGLFILPIMCLGLLLARTRLLERPWERPGLVHTLAWGGLVVGLLGGLPLAGGILNGYTPGIEWTMWAVVHNLTGLVAGLGLACLVALAMSRTERRRLSDPSVVPGPFASALSALGRRSMSGYLAQTVLCLVLFPAYGFGLGDVVGTGGAALIAIGIWLVTLVGAVLLERADKPGPAEWLLRRLAYGRPAAAR